MSILARLTRLRIPIPEGELVTPARLAVEHCLAVGRRRALLIMRDDVRPTDPPQARTRPARNADIVAVEAAPEDNIFARRRPVVHEHAAEPLV